MSSLAENAFGVGSRAGGSRAEGTLAVIWRAGELLFSTAVGHISEVLAPVEATALPAAPGWLRGLFVYRGGLIPLVDGARLIGRTGGPDRMCNRVLVMRTRFGTHEGLVGVYVERVLELDRPAFHDRAAHPGLANDETRFLGRVAETRLGPVQEVVPAELFTEEQARLLWARMKAGGV